MLEASEVSSLTDVLVLTATELDPRLRGAGVGAWASARLIVSLSTPDMLVLAHAAPLRRSAFMPRTRTET